jgi:phosphotransferase system IIB component
MILDEEQMPFTKDGIKPDLIVNPHAIPSRMTIGHLVECVYSKLCCLDGFLGDGSVFINLDYEKIYENLEKHKYEKYGNEILYNGYNGKQLNASIFIGPTYYFRLKHMVAEKINARGTGPKVQLTRQPTGGRRKAGGLRIGEMERDSLISHGISKFIKESLMDRSDNYRWIVCKKCGTAPIYSNKIKESVCKNCGGNEMNIIETPYCFKLLTQEFEGMGIQMRFNCDYTDLQVEEDFSDEDIVFEEDNNDVDNQVELKFKDKFANVSMKELIAKIKTKYPTMKGLTLKKRPELIAILENNEKEVKKNIGNKTVNQLKEEIKQKYPTFKIKATMRKDDLIKILEMTEEEFKNRKGGGESDGYSDSDDSDSNVSDGESDDSDSDDDNSGEDEDTNSGEDEGYTNNDKLPINIERGHEEKKIIFL